MRILTVDPEPRDTAALRSVLRRAGHEVLAVVTLVDAVAMVRYGRIELVLVNGRYPELDARQLRQELRGQGQNQPVISVRLLPDVRPF